MTGLFPDSIGYKGQDQLFSFGNPDETMLAGLLPVIEAKGIVVFAPKAPVSYSFKIEIGDNHGYEWNRGNTLASTAP